MKVKAKNEIAFDRNRQYVKKTNDLHVNCGGQLKNKNGD